MNVVIRTFVASFTPSLVSSWRVLLVATHGDNGGGSDVGNSFSTHTSHYMVMN